MSDWKVRAACVSPDVNPDWFDNQPGLAVHICQRHCKVRAACDEWAEQKHWQGLVVAGYARTATWGRSLRQPAADRSGCPWCPPEPEKPPRAPIAGAGEQAGCPRCTRVVKTLSGGRIPPHKTPDFQRLCS